MKNSDLLDRPTDPTPAEKTTRTGLALRAPEVRTPARETEKQSVIDTSKMSQAQREALELTEAARTVVTVEA